MKRSFSSSTALAKARCPSQALHCRRPRSAAGVSISSALGRSRPPLRSAVGSARLLGMVGDLDQRAVAAAVAVAAGYGLNSDQAVVIYSGSNVLVHLRPASVVARVMTGTVVLHDDPARWLRREISVLEFLAPSGLAVAPSPLIAPGPHHQRLVDDVLGVMSPATPRVSGFARARVSSEKCLTLTASAMSRIWRRSSRRRTSTWKSGRCMTGSAVAVASRGGRGRRVAIPGPTDSAVS
jgi:hypothetical protein